MFENIMELIMLTGSSLAWMFFWYHASSSPLHSDSTIPFKLSSRWKKMLRLYNPDRELYNLFCVIYRVTAFAFPFFAILHLVLLQFFLDFVMIYKLWFSCLLVIIILVVIPKRIDGIICNRIKKKWKNAVLNRCSRWVQIDKEGVRDITLWKTRLMSWQDIQAVGIGNMTTKENKEKLCIYFSVNEVADTNLSYDMADDELFIIDCRKDLVDILLDFAPGEVMPDLTTEWYMNTFTIDNASYGKKPRSTAARYYLMSGIDLEKGNYVRAREWLRKQLNIVETIFGKEDRDIGVICSLIAETYQSQGLYDKSLEWYFKGYQIFVNTSGKAYPGAITVKEMMKAAYCKADSDKSFEEWFMEKIDEIESRRVASENQPILNRVDGQIKTTKSRSNRFSDSFIIYKSRYYVCFLIIGTFVLELLAIANFHDTKGSWGDNIILTVFSIFSIISISVCVTFIRWKVKVVNDLIYITPIIGRVKVVTFSDIEKLEITDMKTIVYGKNSKLFTLDCFCVNEEPMVQRLEDENIPYEFKSNNKDKKKQKTK